MNNQRNNYYTDKDYKPNKTRDGGYDPGFDNAYYNIKSNPTLDNFKVKPLLSNLIVSIILAVVMISFTIPIYLEQRSLNSSLSHLMYYVIAFLIILFVVYFFYEFGTTIEVTGKKIIISKYFFFKETITVDDITYCELFTRHKKESSFSKLIICYKSTKIKIPERSFYNWEHLIIYMTNHHKLFHYEEDDSLQDIDI